MNLTPEQLAKILTNSDITVEGQPAAQNGATVALPAKGQSKYHNRPTDGYQSGKEAARAAELQLLEKAHKIFCLSEQVRIPVSDCMVWVADFVYLDENLNTIFEDVKGVKTAMYRTKKRHFEKKYGKKISEV